MDDFELFTNTYDEFTDIFDDIEEEEEEKQVKKKLFDKNNFSLFSDSNCIILNELNSCKKNSKYIVETKEDICNWRISFKHNNINYVYELFFEINLYPYYPPYIKLIKPIFKDNFIKDIVDIYILKNSVWKSTFYMNDVILNINKFIIENGIVDSINEYTDLDNILVRLPIIYSNKQKTFDNKNKKEKYWTSGTGYGSNSSNNWNMENYNLGEEIRNIYIYDNLEKILLCDDTEENINKIKNSEMCDIIKKYFNTTLLDIDKYDKLYKIIFQIILKYKYFFNNVLQKILEPLYNESIELLKIKNIENVYFANEIINIYNSVKNDKKENNDEKKNDYVSIIKEEQFKFTTIFKNSNIINMLKTIDLNYNKSIIKIGKELVSLNKNLPITPSSSIFIRIDEDESYIIQFIITGPENTPYSNGCFLFSMVVPPSYPNKPPKCLLETTGYNKVRFNANLYNSGKVCLSLLGTWHGRESEMWNPKSSTLLQLLVSIQSLIFVEQPYYNEPGWEIEIGTVGGDKKNKIYNYEIRLNTMKWGILEQLKNPNKNFEKIIKKHFSLKKDIILEECLKWVNDFDKEIFFNIYNDSSLYWVKGYNKPCCNNKRCKKFNETFKNNNICIQKEYTKVYNEIKKYLL